MTLLIVFVLTLLQMFISERGWQGVKIGGQKLGPPDPIGEETFEDFESVCLELKTVAHGTATFGTVRRFR